MSTTPITLTTPAFSAIQKRIYSLAGIALGDGKRLMVEGRLGKRLRELQLSSYEAYLSLLDRAGAASEEETLFINALTTNKTDFYREEHHFDYLVESTFPAILERAARGGPKRLRIWCAASSTGEEPWSLAMTVAESFGTPPGWEVQIFASDIDTNVLETAKRGVYAEDRMSGVSEERRLRHFQAGRGEAAGWFRIKESLRPLIQFRHVNLISGTWNIPTNIDAIFCRNVIIYFDRPTQTRLFDRMADLMAPGGYLFAGHSESLLGVTDRFSPLGNTVYRAEDARKHRRFL